MRTRSRCLWERRLAAVAGAMLALAAAGPARAAEHVAADAPVPTDPLAYGGTDVTSPFTLHENELRDDLPGYSTLSNVVPTVSGRLTRVDVFFSNETHLYARNGVSQATPVVQNFFVDLARVDADGRPTDLLATASVPVDRLPILSRLQVQTQSTPVVFSAGPRVVAGERYALVYRADGCCVGGQDAQETPSVPDGWTGRIPFGSTTTEWTQRYSLSPNFYQGTVAVRMWVDPRAPSLLDMLLPQKPAPGQPIPRAPVGAAPLCGRPVMLTDVTLRGRAVRLAGLARSDYAGRALTITAGGRVVARARVGPGGRFRVTASRTAGSARLRYQAHVADARSAALKANRLLIIDSQTRTARGLRVRGHLISRRRAHRTLTVVRRLGCSPTRTTKAKTVRTDGRGRFSVTLRRPPATQRFAVYRVRTTRGGKTYTLPLVLRTS